MDKWQSLSFYGIIIPRHLPAHPTTKREYKSNTDARY
jgi:hypothetical protein